MLQRGQELQSTEAQPRVSDHPAIKAKITVPEAPAGLPGSLLHSHWSRFNEARLSLVKMVHSVALSVSLMP